MNLKCTILSTFRFVVSQFVLTSIIILSFCRLSRYNFEKIKNIFKDFQGSFSNALWFCPYLSTILDIFVEIVNTFWQYFFVFFSVQNVSSSDTLQVQR